MKFKTRQSLSEEETAQHREGYHETARYLLTSSANARAPGHTHVRNSCARFAGRGLCQGFSSCQEKQRHPCHATHGPPAVCRTPAMCRRCPDTARLRWGGEARLQTDAFHSASRDRWGGARPSKVRSPGQDPLRGYWIRCPQRTGLATAHRRPNSPGQKGGTRVQGTAQQEPSTQPRSPAARFRAVPSQTATDGTPRPSVCRARVNQSFSTLRIQRNPGSSCLQIILMDPLNPLRNEMVKSNS